MDPPLHPWMCCPLDIITRIRCSLLKASTLHNIDPRCTSAHRISASAALQSFSIFLFLYFLFTFFSFFRLTSASLPIDSYLYILLFFYVCIWQKYKGGRKKTNETENERTGNFGRRITSRYIVPFSNDRSNYKAITQTECRAPILLSGVSSDVYPNVFAATTAAN